MTSKEKDRIKYLEKVEAYYKRMLDFNAARAIEYNNKGDVEHAEVYEHHADLYRSRWCVVKNCLAVIRDGDIDSFIMKGVLQ